MLHFPQGRIYRIEHGLGTSPVTVDIFLSFCEQPLSEGCGTDSTQPSNVAPTAGNQALIEVWDEEVLEIRNDTCAEFYLRVVALADPDASRAAAGARN